MCSSGDSDFSKEMASGVAVASSILVGNGVLGLYDDSFRGLPVKRPWYERRCALYSITTVLVLAIAVLVVGGLGVGNKGREPSTTESDNQRDPGEMSTLAPTLAPTSALTDTLAPTLAPTNALTDVLSTPPTSALTAAPSTPPTLTAFERTDPRKYQYTQFVNSLLCIDLTPSLLF
jgi:hypothetical protein